MTKLNDLQLILLSTASGREDGSLIPLPENIAADTARTGKAITTLIRKDLAEEAPVSDRRLAWRDADQQPTGVFITAPGREAIGTDEARAEGEADANAINDLAAAAPASDVNATASVIAASTAASTTPRAGSKTELVLGMLRRPAGATLPELIEATDWLPHTTRAALTGLRKKGHDVVRGKRDGATCYSITPGVAAKAPASAKEQDSTDTPAPAEVHA